MKICIYDLSARYEVQVRDLGTMDLLYLSKLPPALIRKDEKHDNRRFSFFEPENPDFSSLVDMKTDNGLSFRYDNNRLVTLTEIMCNLCFDGISIDETEEYFKGMSRLISGRLKEKGISIDETVILVPDALSLDSQERLLSYFGRYRTSLLWHSMAIALGVEKELLEKGEEGEKIAIVDEFSDIGFFSSKIEIKKENGRAIPCHKIYMKANGLNRKWYREDQESVLIDSLARNVKWNRLQASYRQSGLRQAISFDTSGLPIEQEIKSFRLSVPVIKNASLIISTSQLVDISSNVGVKKLRVDIGVQPFLGAVKYIEYVSKGLVPYYDECESFSVVCQNNKEELEYFELVKENSFLPGGKKMEGNVIDTLFIPKGSKEANFYFHLGNIKDYDAQLKLYIQDFPIEESLKENRRLRLSPSVIPGQGYAQIAIEDFEQEKLFSLIELDWKNMQPATTDEGAPITIKYLELELERSFPPDVPPVRSRYARGTPGNARWELEMLVKHDFSYQINKSIWPNITDYGKGVDRFVRENTFGSYVEGEGNEYRFPKVHGIENEQYVDAFIWAAKQYLNGDDDYLKPLAWSYLRYDLNGKLIPELTKVTARVIKELQTRPKYACPPVHASYIANMIATEREFKDVFLRFEEVLKYKCEGIGNWCRAMYQLLMYTPFIYGNNKELGRCASSCMYNLVAYLKTALQNRNKTTVDNILRVMLYLLKRRVIDKEFFQKESQPESYNLVVEALENVKSKIRDNFIIQTANTIKEYMDGKGTLAGIPLPVPAPVAAPVAAPIAAPIATPIATPITTTATATTAISGS